MTVGDPLLAAAAADIFDCGLAQVAVGGGKWLKALISNLL